MDDSRNFVAVLLSDMIFKIISQQSTVATICFQILVIYRYDVKLFIAAKKIYVTVAWMCSVYLWTAMTLCVVI